MGCFVENQSNEFISFLALQLAFEVNNHHAA